MRKENFEQLLDRLCRDVDLFHGVEEVTRQGAILPILDQLGWNIYNTREVIPEFSLGAGRVDYCLKAGERNSVYLEIKRMSEDLSRHESQLLKYAFEDGIEIAVLTNGLLWWLYLPLERGNWQERKFFTIDIRQQEPATAVGHFCDFLSREAVSNGSALSNARKVQASRVKKQIILQTMPKAWEQMLQEPDDLLMELLADRIESMSGYRPEMDTVENFVKEFAQRSLNMALLSSSSVYEPPQTSSVKVLEPPPISVTTKRTQDVIQFTRSGSKQSGITVQVGTKRIKAFSVPEFYLQIMEFLDESGYLPKIQTNIPYETSQKRYLISRSPVHPHGNRFRAPVEYKGFYLEAHKDYKNAFAAMENFLRIFGIEMHLIQNLFG
jgi:hypothetical protein